MLVLVFEDVDELGLQRAGHRNFNIYFQFVICYKYELAIIIKITQPLVEGLSSVSKCHKIKKRGEMNEEDTR